VRAQRYAGDTHIVLCVRVDSLKSTKIEPLLDLSLINSATVIIRINAHRSLNALDLPHALRCLRPRDGRPVTRRRRVPVE